MTERIEGKPKFVDVRLGGVTEDGGLKFDVLNASDTTAVEEAAPIIASALGRSSATVIHRESGSEVGTSRTFYLDGSRWTACNWVPSADRAKKPVA